MTTTQKFYDITDMSPATLDVFMRIKIGEDGVTVDHLNAAERATLADALGFANDARTLNWITHGTGCPSIGDDAAILATAEDPNA